MGVNPPLFFPKGSDKKGRRKDSSPISIVGTKDRGIIQVHFIFSFCIYIALILPSVRKKRGVLQLRGGVNCFALLCI